MPAVAITEQSIFPYLKENKKLYQNNTDYHPCESMNDAQLIENEDNDNDIYKDDEDIKVVAQEGVRHGIRITYAVILVAYVHTNLYSSHSTIYLVGVTMESTGGLFNVVLYALQSRVRSPVGRHILGVGFQRTSYHASASFRVDIRGPEIVDVSILEALEFSWADSVESERGVPKMQTEEASGLEHNVDEQNIVTASNVPDNQSRSSLAQVACLEPADCDP